MSPNHLKLITFCAIAAVLMVTLLAFYRCSIGKRSEEEVKCYSQRAAKSLTQLSCGKLGHLLLQTTTNPSYLICLQPLSKDYPSRTAAHQYNWEHHILETLGKMLARDASVGFIDIGAHIGFHSLYAAALGHKVLAVEPFPDNLDLLTHSIIHNGFQDKVKVIDRPVFSRRKMIHFVCLDKNFSGRRVVGQISNKEKSWNCDFSSEALTMDDLVPFISFQKAVVKLDIEGSECEALASASTLFERIDIHAVFMEWMHQEKVSYRNCVENMITMLQSKKFQPYTVDKNRKALVGAWINWPADVVWLKKQDN